MKTPSITLFIIIISTVLIVIIMGTVKQTLFFSYCNAPTCVGNCHCVQRSFCFWSKHQWFNACKKL